MAVLGVEIKDQTRAGKIKVIRSLDDIKKSAKGAGDSVEKFDDALDDAGRTASKTGQKVEDSAGKFDKLKGSVGNARKSILSVKGAIAGIGGALAAQQVIAYADAWTATTNQLRLVTSSTEQLASTQEKLFQLAQNTRSSLEGTVDLYSKLARTTGDLGLSQDELLQITTTVNQAIQASGAPAASAEAALVQLGQGFAAGALRGEELNSVMEQTPRLARAIADGMGISIGALREFGAEGALTAETVTKALLSQGDVVRDEFLKTEQTVGSAFTNLCNSLTKVVGKINEATGATGLITLALNGLSEELGGTGTRSIGSGRAASRRRDLEYGSSAGASIEPNAFDRNFNAITSGRRYGRGPGGRIGSAEQQRRLAQSQAFDQQNRAMAGAQSERAFLTQTREERAVNQQEQALAETRRLAFLGGEDYWIDSLPSDPAAADADLDFDFDVESLLDENFFDVIEREFEANDLFSEEMLRNSQALAESSKEKFAIDQKLFSQQLKEKGLTDTQIAQLLKGREAIFAHTEALKNQTQELETQEAALAAGVAILGSLNKDLGNFAKVGTDLFAAFTDGNPAQQIGAVAGGITFLVDTFFGLDDSAEKAEQAVANLNRELERADRSAQNVIEDLFDQDISAGRERIFSVFEELFTRLNTDPTVNIGGATGMVDDLPDTQADAVRTLFDFIANFDAAGVSNTLEKFESSSSLSQRRLVGAIESSFTSFDEFEQVFLQTFGDTGSFNEIATAFFDSSDAFDHLRKSATKATEATRGLTDEQERATRLQFAAEEQAARLERSEKARLAGSDAFLQRRGLDTFLSTYTSIQRSRDLALSRGGTTTSGSPETTGTTGAASTSAAAASVEITAAAVENWMDLLEGAVIDGSIPLEINFSDNNGTHELKIWKRRIDSFDDLLFGTAYDGRTPLEINFGEGGTHQLNITGQYSLSADDLFRVDASEGIDFDFGFLQSFDRVNVTPARFAIADLIEIDASRMINLDLSSVINVDASNLKDAIARAVQEAIDDRDFDSPYLGTQFGATGCDSGRQ